MGSKQYPIPKGLYAVPEHLLDLRPDAEVDHDILHPQPVTGEKNIWFFWHSGYSNMHPYAKRNVRSWHRRFSKQGWAVRVLDKEPDSPLNVAHYIDTNDPDTVPRAFTEGTLAGKQGLQHISDLVRLPLLLKYGGVYADVGMIQIGDLDRLWNETIGNPDSPYEVLSYDFGEGAPSLANYFMASGRNNPFFTRCHKLLLALWAADGGKTTTDGMHTSPLVKNVPLIRRELSFEEDGKIYGPDEVSRLLSDYIIQCQAIAMVIGLVDEADDWDGPRYAAEHIYTVEFMTGAQLINELTMWNGPRQFELMSLPLPRDGEPETADQKQAREVVETVLQRSFGFKLATGLILRVMGPTLGSLWRDNGDADAVEGTYAGWFRHATMYWNQEKIPPNNPFKSIQTYKRGPLLKE